MKNAKHPWLFYWLSIFTKKFYIVLTVKFLSRVLHWAKFLHRMWRKEHHRAEYCSLNTTFGLRKHADCGSLGLHLPVLRGVHSHSSLYFSLSWTLKAKKEKTRISVQNSPSCCYSRFWPVFMVVCVCLHMLFYLHICKVWSSSKGTGPWWIADDITG